MVFYDGLIFFKNKALAASWELFDRLALSLILVNILKRKKNLYSFFIYKSHSWIFFKKHSLLIFKKVESSHNGEAE